MIKQMEGVNSRGGHLACKGAGCLQQVMVVGKRRLEGTVVMVGKW